GRGEDFARRVDRREHQVRLAGLLVQPGHRLRGEEPRERPLERGELLVARLELVEGLPVAAAPRVGGEARLLEHGGDRLETRNAGASAAEPEAHEAVPGRPDLARPADLRPLAPAALTFAKGLR